MYDGVVAIQNMTQATGNSISRIKFQKEEAVPVVVNGACQFFKSGCLIISILWDYTRIIHMTTMLHVGSP